VCPILVFIWSIDYAKLLCTGLCSKLYIQAGGEGVLYSSTLDCFWKTLRAEGPQGLYKGFIPV
jgi:hypothetical protein